MQDDLYDKLKKWCESENCNNIPRKWSQLAYAGECKVPRGIDPSAGSWPLFFMKRDSNGNFFTLDGKIISFNIQDPGNINFDEELKIVKHTLNNLTDKQKQIAKYWGNGPPTKQWTPICDRLIDTYNFTPVRAARVCAALQGAINDAMVITWYYKYLWDVARPNQLDQELATEICTPKFPTYPSGHSVMSGTAEVVLSYFFSPEAKRLQELAEEDSISRLFGGIHFPSDLIHGLQLGRQIGGIVVEVLSNQHDSNQSRVDGKITKNLHAQLMPPPYKQVISYKPRARACNLPLLPDSD